MLLDYIRIRSGAQLTLLFLLDTEHQALVLLERCAEDSARDALVPTIPLDGLFGTALHTQGWLFIVDSSADRRSLNEELYWTGEESTLLIGRVGMPDTRQGVLVLRFGSREKEQEQGKTPQDWQAIADSGDILICMTLLSVYLSDNLAEQRLAVDQERSRIARDIHDGAAQDIAHVVHKLEYIQRVFEKLPEVALQEVRRAYEMLEGSLKELRHSIVSLLPSQVEELGFEAALRTLLDEYALREPGLTIEADIEHADPLPSALKITLFRFIQEGLTNVGKHAQASRVRIFVCKLPGLLLAEISDNGQGFSVESMLGRMQRESGEDAVRHLGLASMGERIQQARGNWEIQSTPGQGTTIKARFPLAIPSSMCLTKREREVLRLLVEGLTNRAIAERLSVSTETVKSHVHHIMQKMQARDRTQAVVLATRLFVQI